MDTRTKAEKLRAMAAASESPHEAAVARAKLEAMAEPLQARQSRPRMVFHMSYGFGDTTTMTFRYGTRTTSTGGR